MENTVLFGNKSPVFTKHFLLRYVERLLHVDPACAKSYVDLNHVKIYKEIVDRLKKAVPYDEKLDDKDFVEYLKTKYRIVDNLRFARHNSVIFVIKSETNGNKIIVTCYKEEK